MAQQPSLNKLSEPIFSKKKSLLTVGQYASRQGVSTGIVQECARLGVVQVRKHKNKTFIVDLPLDIYKIIKQQDSQSPEEIDGSSCVNKITDLVNRIFQSENETQPLPAGIKRTEGEKNSGLKTIEISPVPAESLLPQPRHKEPEAIPNLKQFVEKESGIAAGKNKNEPDFGKFRIPLLRSITESIRAVSVWRLSFVLVTTAFVISICAYTRVSMDRKIQQEKLQQAYESINKLIGKYEDVKQQAKLYELDMMSWQSEAERSKKALFNSEAELQDTRKNLYEAKKDLETMQQHNTETLKELNEKISRIRSHIPDVGERPVQ
jgi:hypothetical protein